MPRAIRETGDVICLRNLKIPRVTPIKFNWNARTNAANVCAERAQHLRDVWYSTTRRRKQFSRAASRLLRVTFINIWNSVLARMRVRHREGETFEGRFPIVEKSNVGRKTNCSIFCNFSFTSISSTLKNLFETFHLVIDLLEDRISRSKNYTWFPIFLLQYLVYCYAKRWPRVAFRAWRVKISISVHKVCNAYIGVGFSVRIEN